MNSLITYVDTRAAEVANAEVADEVAACQQAVTDSQSARDAAVAAKDTAVSTVSDCVKKTPAGLQTITGYGLQCLMGFIGPLTGTVTGSVNGNAATASKLGTSTVGSTTKPIYLNGGTATLCNEICDLASAQTVTGVKTFSASPVVPTVATGTADTKAANGTKVKNELDAYTPMVRTTGNQTIAGAKSFTDPVFVSRTGSGPLLNLTATDYDFDVHDTLVALPPPLTLTDPDGKVYCQLIVQQLTTGATRVFLRVKNADGTNNDVLLGAGS